MVFAILLLGMNAVVQDSEHKDLFKIQKDSTLTKVGGHPLIDDITITLEAMGATTGDMYRLIKMCGMENSESACILSENVATLQKLNHFRSAIYASVLPDSIAGRQKLVEFETCSLEKKSTNLFSLLETIAGSARPYFLNESIKHMSISMPWRILDIILFLIFHDEILMNEVSKPIPAIATLNCQFRNTDGSCVFSIKRIVLDEGVDQAVQVTTCVLSTSSINESIIYIHFTSTLNTNIYMQVQ